MKRVAAATLALTFTFAAHADGLMPGGVQLLCHRTANRDVPENTLESLDEAALLGCNVVELDIRRTLDGQLVLNHDGVLERLTDGFGDVETSYLDDLRMRDAGSWMGERFTGLRMPLFADALRLARDRDLRLILDIKDKNIGAAVLQLVQREGMLERVRFNGEWADVKLLYPQANTRDEAIWVQPGITAEQVNAYHREGKAVVANFSDNAHELDLAAMKAAVAAGVDGINVDYPRLGADAVGRPVERTLAALARQANDGTSEARAEAILALSRYRGFALEPEFAHSLLDANDHVSRAAALALVTARPRTPLPVFADALQSPNADARANAAWALGRLHAPATLLLPLLADKNPQVLQEALLALSRASGEVPAPLLLPLLAHGNPKVRGAAALALARHVPAFALPAINAQLQREILAVQTFHTAYVKRGQPKLSPAEIDDVTGRYRCQMKMIEAISSMGGAAATEALAAQAFHTGEDDFTQMDRILAAFQLWDRIGADPSAAVQALASSDPAAADRAEWVLIQGGPGVLPAVRSALLSTDAALRQRAMYIVGWQGDVQALPALQAIADKQPQEVGVALWAIAKIHSLHPLT